MDDPYGTADWLLSQLDANDEVAYAEVGGVERTGFDIVMRDGNTYTAKPSQSMVWFRIFSDGAADYRYTNTLERSHLDDLIERAIRSCRHLNQSAPASYDAGSFHRETHNGWAPSDRIDDADVEAVVTRVGSAKDSAFADVFIDRSRIETKGTQVDQVLLTTTGSVVLTALSRMSVDLTVVPDSGTKIREHAGSTTGTQFLNRIDSVFSTAAERALHTTEVDVVNVDESTSVTGLDCDVVLSPTAAGKLFHHISHFFERDTIYLGAKPFEMGEEIGPNSLTVTDILRPGAWGARAYDAEATPTRPVTLIENGIVTNFLDNTASAAEEGTIPQGHAIPSLGAEHPPRIHVRNLEVGAGSTPISRMLANTDLYIEQLGEGRLLNEATRTKRFSTFPPTVLYAKDAKERTPQGYNETSDQRIQFPIREGYIVVDGEKTAMVNGATLEFSISDLDSISAVGVETEDQTGTCEKHTSRIPYTVTAPAIRIKTCVLGRRQ